jgi:hypothetical protein
MGECSMSDPVFTCVFFLVVEHDERRNEMMKEGTKGTKGRVNEEKEGAEGGSEGVSRKSG